MQIREAGDVIREALSSVKVVDPHCHLRPEKPSADNLADIVLYHHVWIELVSSGMGLHEVSRPGLPHELCDPGMPPAERLGRAVGHLKEISNTTIGLYLRWILEDLYGIEGGLTEGNLEEASRIAEEKGRSPGWQEEVLRDRCGIECSLTVEGDGSPCSKGILRGKEWAPFNLADGKQSAREILSGMEEAFGREIETAGDYRESLAKAVDELPAGELKFVGFWLLPHLRSEGAHEADVDRILRKVKRNEPLSRPETGGFCYFGVTSALELLRETGLRTIQLIVGAEVLPPHRSVTHWAGGFPGAVARIARLFEDFRFDMSSASDIYTQDLGILARHVPNISVAGYWWHTLYPFYIKKSIETRLDMVPMSKIVGFFSDAYHCEWCYPKLKMVKQIWAEVLLERIGKGWLDIDTAVDLVHRAFHDNPKRIYGTPG